MESIKATYKNGQIVPDRPVNWPEGCRLTVEPEDEDLRFMTEDEQSDDPEAIARWLAEFDAIPPLQMTPAEEADWLGWREKVKEYSKEAVRRQMEEGMP